MKKLSSLILNKKCFLIIHFIFFSTITVGQEHYNGLNVPEGFHVELFASDVLAPRQMAEGEDFVFVGGIKGQIFALNKENPKQKILLASDLNNSRGVALKEGDLYFAEVDKIWIIRDVERLLNSEPDQSISKELFNDDLPSDAWHGGKWIGMAANGSNLVLMETFTQMLGRHVIFVMMDSLKIKGTHLL